MEAAKYYSTGSRDRWEVEGFGLLEESTILQGLREGWLTLDHRVRQQGVGGTEWTRIRVRLRPEFPFKALMDPAAAYGEMYSKYGIGLGVALGATIFFVLEWLYHLRQPFINVGGYITILGFIGWRVGEWVGERVGSYKARHNPLPSTLQPPPTWIHQKDLSEKVDHFVRNYNDRFDIVYNYYEQPSREKALEMLKVFVSSEVSKDKTAWPLFLYFFLRVAEDHPRVVGDYEHTFHRMRGAGRQFILLLRRLEAESHGRHFLKAEFNEREQAELEELYEELPDGFPSLCQGAFDVPVKDTLDLGLLWIEFCYSGDRKPVIRVMDVLLSPDRVRRKLRAWLDATPGPDFPVPSEWKRWWDIKNWQDLIKLDYDLDYCWLMSEDLYFRLDALERIRQVFPFPLSDEDLMCIGVKSAAKWSLGVNAIENLRVFEGCREELDDKDSRFGFHPELKPIVVEAKGWW